MKWEAMESILGVGRWIADGHHCNLQEERRRTLFAILLLHYLLSSLGWLLIEGIFGYGDQHQDLVECPGQRSSVEVDVTSPSLSPHYHTLLIESYSLIDLRMPHFFMLGSNVVLSLSLLVLLSKQVSLFQTIGIWAAYIYLHAFYYALYRPHASTDKWFLIVPLQVFFGLGARRGVQSLCCSFVMQILLFYTRQYVPVASIVLESPANCIANFAYLSYVGIACGGYEYVRAYALDRMETALNETERANRNLKKAIKIKERFLANVSHELRTPMHGILATVEEMVHTAKVRRSRKLREAVTLIADCSDHLCMVINDILDFQTLGSDQIRLERLQFDITEQIEQVCQMVMASEKHGKQLHFEKSVIIPHSLRMGDPRRTRQIIFNLLSNAFKFTGHGGAVRLEANENGGGFDYVVLRIADTGIGMSEECMAKIFHGFSQGDTSLRREYGGSGLGLAISKRLAEAMGGKIECQSKLGQGSTFTLTLRLPLATPRVNHLSLSTGCIERLCGGLMGRHCRDSPGLLPQQGEAVGVSGALTRKELECEEGSNQRHPDKSPLVRSAPPSSSLSWAAHASTRKRCLAGKSAAEERNATNVEAKAEGSNPPQAATETESKEAAEGDQLKGKRVLLVEDNLVNQKVGVRMLRSLSCEAMVAVNGVEALNAVERHYDVATGGHANGSDQKGEVALNGKENGHVDKQENGDGDRAANQIDLILMDCQMPVMDGFKATARIRKLERQIGHQRAPALSSPAPPPHIPILALTASATAEYQQKCFRHGMDDFLTKPLNRATLEQMLNKWLLEPYEAEDDNVNEAPGSSVVGR